MARPRSLDMLDTRLRPICDAIFQQACVPGASVAVMANGVGYHYAFGVKAISTGEPVTITTGFNIGSCTKAFTSATIASLVADGLLSWEDPVSKWAPELQFYDPAITRLATLRDLSANRTGLPRAGLMEFGLNPALPPEYVFERLRHTQPAFPFRDRYTYVNAGHTVNAVVAGRVTGKGYLATVRERILAPLGMTTTSGGAATPDDLGDLAGWHVIVDGRPVEIDPVFSDMYFGAGGMVVSGQDALRWLNFHLEGGRVDGTTVVPDQALRECYRPHALATPGIDQVNLFYPEADMAAYALGWGVSNFGRHKLVMHSGSDFGATAMTLLVPEEKIGIAVYCNSNGGGPDSLAASHAIATTLLGAPLRDWFAYFEKFRRANLAPAPIGRPDATAAPTDLSAYEGRFVHAADGPLDIQRDGKVLTGNLQDGYRMDFTLIPIGNDEFALEFTQPEWTAAAPSPRLSFALESGRAVTAKLSVTPEPRVFARP